MSSTGSRRQIIVLGGVALAGAVLGVIAVREAWPALMKRRYLGELREDPTLLFEFLDSDDDIRHAAAEDFLEERPAKEEIFRRYLDEFDASKANWNVHRSLKRRRETGTVAGYLGLTPTGIFTHSRRTNGGGNTGSMASAPIDPARRKRLLDLIGACTSEVFEHAEFPGFEFQVVRVENNHASEPSWPGAAPAPTTSRPRKMQGKSDHVLFFRILR